MGSASPLWRGVVGGFRTGQRGRLSESKARQHGQEGKEGKLHAFGLGRW